MSEPRRALKRRRYGWRRIHKWIGVTGGALLLIWIVTGIAISIPAGGQARLFSGLPPFDWETAVVAPAEAVARLAAQDLESGNVQSIMIARLGKRPAYRIQMDEGQTHLVDAGTGDLISIDELEALRIANDVYSGPGTAIGAQLVESHDLGYFNGEVPAYRVTFTDRYGTSIYVGARTGSVAWWDAKSRTRRYMAAFHDLWPSRVFSIRLYQLLMVGGGLLALTITITGYYLAWRRGGWRWRWRRAPVDPSPPK